MISVISMIIIVVVVIIYKKQAQPNHFDCFLTHSLTHFCFRFLSLDGKKMIVASKQNNNTNPNSNSKNTSRPTTSARGEAFTCSPRFIGHTNCSWISKRTSNRSRSRHRRNNKAIIIITNTVRYGTVPLIRVASFGVNPARTQTEATKGGFVETETGKNERSSAIVKQNRTEHATTTTTNVWYQYVETRNVPGWFLIVHRRNALETGNARTWIQAVAQKRNGTKRAKTGRMDCIDSELVTGKPHAVSFCIGFAMLCDAMQCVASSGRKPPRMLASTSKRGEERRS